ncbi:hypothetical protein [Anaerorhabdus sp.]|uniref:hypothetical protein n=1 Tax=Anaerorhabdus sp. TaxID=1872524 RepID=UPI002FC8F9C9
MKRILLIILCMMLVSCTQTPQNKNEESSTFSIGDQEVMNKMIYDENFFFPFILQQKYISTKYNDDNVSINFYNNAKFDALFYYDGEFNYNYSFQPLDLKISDDLNVNLFTTYTYVPDYYESHLLAYITINNEAKYYTFDQNRVQLLNYGTEEVVTLEDDIQAPIIELLKEQWNDMMNFRVVCQTFSNRLNKVAYTDEVTFNEDPLPVEGFVLEWDENLNSETGIYQGISNFPITEFIKINDEEIKSNIDLSQLENMASLFYFLKDNSNFNAPNYDQILAWLFNTNYYGLNTITLEQLNDVLTNTLNLDKTTINYDLILKNGITQEFDTQSFNAIIPSGVGSGYLGIIIDETEAIDKIPTYNILPYDVIIKDMNQSIVSIQGEEILKDHLSEEEIVTYLQDNLETLPHWKVSIENGSIYQATAVDGISESATLD